MSRIENLPKQIDGRVFMHSWLRKKFRDSAKPEPRGSEFDRILIIGIALIIIIVYGRSCSSRSSDSSNTTNNNTIITIFVNNYSHLHQLPSLL